jgi:CRP/FNR family cyclic AMP-dependent transcriptional regulator
MSAPAQKPLPPSQPAKPSTSPAAAARPLTAVPSAPKSTTTAPAPTAAGAKPPVPGPRPVSAPPASAASLQKGAAPATGTKPGTPTAGAPQPASTTPASRRLKKGEILFNEGETSKAMYFIKAGMIRVFKKKGDSSIEIDTIHAGQVIGELAFLDGNPRSASAEALTEVEVSEVSGPTFQAVLVKMPEWLKILLKAVVGRLRTASTRIRQLEQASTAFDYDKDGKRGQSYVYLSPHDSLKIASAILLVAGRNATKAADGIECKMPQLQRYFFNIMGVPFAKATAYFDILQQCDLVVAKEADLNSHIYLKDGDLLEKYINYQVEENLAEPSKRHDMTARTFFIMNLIAKHLPTFPVDASTGMVKVNVAEIRKKETVGGKEPFRLEEFPELVKMGYCTQLNMASATEAFTQVKADSFLLHHRFQKINTSLNTLNEQKRGK